MDDELMCEMGDEDLNRYGPNFEYLNEDEKAKYEALREYMLRPEDPPEPAKNSPLNIAVIVALVIVGGIILWALFSTGGPQGDPNSYCQYSCGIS